MSNFSTSHSFAAYQSETSRSETSRSETSKPSRSKTSYSKSSSKSYSTAPRSKTSETSQSASKTQPSRIPEFSYQKLLDAKSSFDMMTAADKACDYITNWVDLADKEIFIEEQYSKYLSSLAAACREMSKMGVKKWTSLDGRAIDILQILYPVLTNIDKMETDRARLKISLAYTYKDWFTLGEVGRLTDKINASTADIAAWFKTVCSYLK